MVDSVEGLSDVTFNVYVGAETGVLKGVCFGDGTVPVLKNYKPGVGVTKLIPIVDLFWTNYEEQNRKDLVVAFGDGVVKWYNTKLKCFEQEYDLELGPSPLVSLRQCKKHYIAAQEDGSLSFWSCEDFEVSSKVETNSHFSKMRQSTCDPAFIATGGRESDLKIWNLESERPEIPKFKAKNVPHDELDLKQPVWIQDLTFLPQTTDLVATATRYGQVRLYDVRATPKNPRDQNRPVINMQLCDHALMSISSTNNTRQVVAGSAKGEVALVDLRYVGQQKIVHKFHGFSGSVRSISSDESSPYFVSCSLDRFLYLHDFNKKEAVKRLYLKSRLTCVLITDKFMTPTEKEAETAEIPTQKTSGYDLGVSWTNLDMESILPRHSCIPMKKKKKTKTHDLIKDY